MDNIEVIKQKQELLKKAVLAAVNDLALNHSLYITSLNVFTKTETTDCGVKNIFNDIEINYTI